MKKLLYLLLLIMTEHSFAQSIVKDDAVINQSQRMVFQQWDSNKFYPKPGFLYLNPYYWLVWGLFDPNYHNTDRRPLSATGPQTQRLGLVSVLNNTDNKYKLQSDTVHTVANSQLTSQSGLLSDADPLWLLYYRQQFNPLLNYSPASILGGLSAQVSSRVVAEGTYSWYTASLDRLRERLNGARSADMDRGSRIMAYYRMLREYKELAGVWAVRVASAQKNLEVTQTQQQVSSRSVPVTDWTPQSDAEIARKVLANRKY